MKAVVGLGANLGDRMRSLREAVTRLEALGSVVGRSPIYETEPVGAPPPSYLNAAILLETNLAPEALMERLLSIEAAMGRTRKERNEPRVIDLDILWIEGLSVSTEALVVPHPRLAERAFALAPLLDLVPSATHPTTKRRYADVPEGQGSLVPVGHF